MSRPVLWVAVTVLGLEAVAGLVGVSVLSYRAVTAAGFSRNTGADEIGRTLVVVALLALVGAACAMVAGLVRHRARGGVPARHLVWAALTVLVTHGVVALGCLARAEWAAAVVVVVAGTALASAWSRCVRRHAR